MTIKVNYEAETTLVKGYYPDSINYASIPEPFIEITNEEHQESLGKSMCVVAGIFREYVESDAVILKQAQDAIISQLKLNLELENNKPCLVKVGDIEFLIKKEDERTIERRITRLSALPSGSTAEWSDSSKERLNLTLAQFQELLRTLTNHLDVRDEQNFAIYFSKKKEIEEALTVEEANEININFN